MPETQFFNEMFAADGSVRTAYKDIAIWLDGLPDGHLAGKSHEAELLFRRMGITFLVYGHAGANERLIPFDLIPRVFSAPEWDLLAKGSIQRVRALNMFLHDLYHGAEIVKAGKIPAELVFNNEFYQIQMHGLDVPGGVYAHIAGIDLVRVGENEFYVLEDNLRSPSGVSYMLENRAIMMRLFPDLFSNNAVAPVDHYPEELLRNLRAVAPADAGEPTVVLLTPGAYNSAYFEHAYIADSMGIELVEAADLFVRDAHVYMRTTEGPQRVDVIYRRIDDDFIDPLAFRSDSMLGVPGLLSAYRSGGVTVANAMTSRSIPTFPKSSGSISARNRS